MNQILLPIPRSREFTKSALVSLVVFGFLAYKVVISVDTPELGMYLLINSFNNFIGGIIFGYLFCVWRLHRYHLGDNRLYYVELSLISFVAFFTPLYFIHDEISMAVLFTLMASIGSIGFNGFITDLMKEPRKCESISACQDNVEN